MWTQFVANWNFIRNRQQHSMLQGNRRKNQHRISQNFAIGDMVLIRNDKIKSKLSKPIFGPFPIIQPTPNQSIVTILRNGYNDTLFVVSSLLSLWLNAWGANVVL
jgi:hypothetical protein